MLHFLEKITYNAHFCGISKLEPVIGIETGTETATALATETETEIEQNSIEQI